MKRTFAFFTRIHPHYPATALLGSAAFIGFNTDENWTNLLRPLMFWKAMFPIYLQYKFKEWQDYKDWDSIHKHYAPQVLAAILDLKGIYVKLGQIMSQRPDMAPDVYREAFKVLLDGVNGVSGPEARAMVEENLGVPIDSIFSYFDDVPIGSASIAQVHYARLLNGKEVVVKVQHPNGFEMFQSDIKTINTFVRMAQPEQQLTLDEFERQFLLEFDFEREAWALETMYRNLNEEFPNIVIPRPVPDLVRRKILVMDYVPGVKLIDAVIEEAQRTASDLCMTLEELQFKAYHPTIIFKLKYFGYIIKRKISYGFTVIYNSVFSGIFKLKPLDYPFHLNIYKLYDELLQVHGKQLLIDGLFNGDPHPGNLLVTPEGNLGLIDFGQVKSITPKARLDIAEIIQLLSKGPSSKFKLIEKAKEVGLRTETDDPEVLHKACILAFDRDDMEMTEGMGLQAYIAEVGKREQTKQLPEQFIMAVRMCIILRGLGAILGPHHPPVSLAQRWKKLAERSIAIHSKMCEQTSS
jgi:aarF domain-containing kinase